MQDVRPSVQFQPWSASQPLQFFSRKEAGPTGFLSERNRLYAFLKGGPASDLYLTGAAKDPASRVVMHTYSNRFYAAANRTIQELWRTKRQIRANEFRGLFVPKYFMSLPMGNGTFAQSQASGSRYWMIALGSLVLFVLFFGR